MGEKNYEIRELSLDEGTIYIVLSEKKYVATVKFDSSNCRCYTVDDADGLSSERVYSKDGTCADKEALVHEAVSNFIINKIKNINAAYWYYY